MKFTISDIRHMEGLVLHGARSIQIGRSGQQNSTEKLSKAHKRKKDIDPIWTVWNGQMSAFWSFHAVAALTSKQDGSLAKESRFSF